MRPNPDLNLYDIFAQNADVFPAKSAIHCADRDLTYAELNESVLSLAYGLRTMGLVKGNHVAVICGNGLEYAIIMLACARIGAIIVPIPISFKIDQLEKALSATDSQFAIAWHTVAKKLLEKELITRDMCISVGEMVEGCFYFDVFAKAKKEVSIEKVTSENSYILTMTSGSTGNPKPIVFSQKTKILRAFEGTIRIYDLTSEDIVLVSTPLYHSLGQRSLLVPLLIGGTAVILRKFSAKGWVDAVVNYKVSFLFAVSSQLDSVLSVLDGTQDLSMLKTIVSSSATLKNESKKKLLEEFSCDIRECYGTSEIGVATEFSIRDQSRHLRSVGKPLPYVKLRVVDKNRKPICDGRVGEIACSSITKFLGYYKNPKNTKEVLDDQGFFYTGDLGFLDENGYLHYQGRAKEVIVTGGINVYPLDVEDVIRKSSEIEDVAVVGVSDARFGERIVACVIAKNALGKPSSRDLELSLRQLCLSKLADYQQPVEFRFYQKFPRSSLGKILKQKLIQQ